MCRSGDIASPLLTSVLTEWSASRPSRLTPTERVSGTRWIWGWVGPRAGVGTVKRKTYLVPSGNSTPAVRPVAHRYTD
jgi:hypothetical protein